MSEEKQYRCQVCGRQAVAGDQENPPQCCDQLMLPEDVIESETDFCVNRSDPRHARFKNDDMPCDDNRAGNVEQRPKK